MKVCRYFLSGPLLILSFLCVNCGVEPDSAGHPVFTIPREDARISVFDIFEQVKLIPLETTAESLLRFPYEMDMLGDTVYVFDKSQYGLYIFGPDGKFIEKIHRVGRGPDEYLMAYDFALDKQARRIHMLDPQGSIYSYRYDGSLAGTIRLPGPPPYNYKYMELAGNGDFITFTSTDADESHVVNIIDPSTGRIKNGYFTHSSIWSTFVGGSSFYTYNAEVYYFERLDHKVYRIEPDSYSVAYQWDTGVKRLIDPKRLKVEPAKLQKTVEKVIEDLEAGDIPYFFARQLQTDTYAYALLVDAEPRFRTLLYNKNTGEGIGFETTTEGVRLHLDKVDDNGEYALGYMHPDNVEALKSVLSAEDVQLLESRKGDDNPWLVKYVFRK